MADAVGNINAHDYHLDVPPADTGFFVKGLGNTDWGMKNRLSRIFDPKSGNTVMLAFDHGYFMGATAGLERMDVTIAPLCEYADVLMATRGAIRSCIPPTANKATCLRATHDTSVLFDDLSTGSGLALDFEDAIRMNASALAIQCFIGGKGEAASLEALCRALGLDVEKLLGWDSSARKMREKRALYESMTPMQAILYDASKDLTEDEQQAVLAMITALRATRKN